MHIELVALLAFEGKFRYFQKVEVSQSMVNLNA